MPKALTLPPHTPEKLPVPTSKFMLMAQKRAEKDSAKARKQKPKEADGAASSAGKPKGKSKALKQGERKGPENGPVYTTMQAFLKRTKARGFTHAEALAKWKTSAQRAEIVSKMPLAERKKRRYE